MKDQKLVSRRVKKCVRDNIPKTDIIDIYDQEYPMNDIK